MYKFLLLAFLFLTPHLFFGNITYQNHNDKKNTTNFIQPAHLKKGDTILIIAPAGKIKDKEYIIAGIKLAKKWGLVVVYGKHLYAQENSFAGTDDERLNDLQKGLDNPSIKAIWSARGGYGLVRIIDDLDFTKFKLHPKWIVGYSDITVLHNKIHNLGYQTIHGQMPGTLDLDNPDQKESTNTLYKALFGKKIKYKLPSSNNNRTGQSSGPIIGGNLSIVYSMLGSDTSLDTTNKILFLEDVSEPLYHIDRMMISLKRAGYFENCVGLILGDFKLKENNGNPFGKTVEEIVLEAVEGTDFPIIFNFPAGHIDDNRSLVLGANVELLVTNNKAKINFK